MINSNNKQLTNLDFYVASVFPKMINLKEFHFSLNIIKENLLWAIFSAVSHVPSVYFEFKKQEFMLTRIYSEFNKMNSKNIVF